MIVVSKVLLGSVTAALLAGSVAVPDIAETARDLVDRLWRSAPAVEAVQVPPHCPGSCDVWELLSHSR